MPRMGLESELHIVSSKTGGIKNSAKWYVTPERHPRVTREPGDSTWEGVNSQPFQDVRHAYSDLIQTIRELLGQAETRQEDFLPSTVIAPGERITVQMTGRYGKYADVEGKDAMRTQADFNGTHLNIERHPDDGVATDQYNLLIALDPLFALGNSTSMHRGNNSLASYRIPMTRDKVYARFPEAGTLRPYIESIEEYDTWMDGVFNQKRARFEDKGHELGPEERDKTGSRIRLKNNRIEVRTIDNTTPYIAAGIATIYMGIVRQLPTQVSLGTWEPGRFKEGNTFHTPSFDQILAFENAGYTQGLEHDGLRAYLTELVQAAQPGVFSIEKPFFEGIEEQLKTRRTVSTQVMDYSREITSSPTLNQLEGREVQRLLGARFRREVYGAQ